MNFRALITTVFAIALTSASPAAAATWTGINDISAFSGAVPFNTAAQAAADAGANSTRMIVDWSWIEGQNDQFSWGMVDGVYWADLARGIRPLIGITGAPRWAWDPSATCAAGTSCAYPPGRNHDADFRDVVQRIARRYPQAVAIEIGNEPNLSWAWAGGLDPARYTELLKVGYAAVKSINPGMPVLSAGLASVLTDTTTADAIGVRPFLRAMYANGAKGSMDGISIHAYPYSVNFSESFGALSAVKDIRAANGDTVPLWVTEFGMTTSSGFDSYQQGVTLPALYDALRNDPDIRGVYTHTLYDDPSNGELSERGYGLLDADGTPKPAYCNIAALNGKTAACPPGAPVAQPAAVQSARWKAQVLLQAAVDAARRAHGTTGSYASLTSTILHNLDARLSTVPLVGSVVPGLLADPAKIGVYPMGGDAVELCNASAADRSYCVVLSWGKATAYGSAAGTPFAAASATIWGSSRSW
jgi:hypothetical protein